MGPSPQGKRGMKSGQKPTGPQQTNKKCGTTHRRYHLIPGPSQADRVRRHPRGQGFLLLHDPPSCPSPLCHLRFPLVGLEGKGAGVRLGERHRGGRMAGEWGAAEMRERNPFDPSHHLPCAPRKTQGSDTPKEDEAAWRQVPRGSRSVSTSRDSLSVAQYFRAIRQLGAAPKYPDPPP